MQKVSCLPFYNGAKICVLHAFFTIINLQSVYGLLDASVSKLLKQNGLETLFVALKQLYFFLSSKFVLILQRLLRDHIFPIQNDIAPTCGDAKKLLKSMVMNYTKIHACSNYGILFCNKCKHLHACQKCGAKKFREDLVDKEIPIKVLFHFPMIPKLRACLYANQYPN